jgi:metal-responsive CopG/Arc/MetJ family transcriptional regulator
MTVARMTKNVGFTVPLVMVEEIEQMAEEEQRTKSELFREMVRVYRSYRRKRPDQKIGHSDKRYPARVN